MVGSHRFAYELLVGPIPAGLVLDHLCRVRNCCNPAHLLTGTHSDNIVDAYSRNRRKPARGEQSSWAKFTDEQIARVRELREAGWTTVAIAEATGVSSSYVSRLCRRQRRAAA